MNNLTLSFTVVGFSNHQRRCTPAPLAPETEVPVIVHALAPQTPHRLLLLRKAFPAIFDARRTQTFVPFKPRARVHRPKPAVLA